MVIGPAWTGAGGEILEIEAGMIRSGKLVLTGNLRDAMEESAGTVKHERW